MKEIEITIDKETLELHIEAKGYKGVGCTKDIEAIMNMLNARTVTRKSKPERVLTTQTSRAKR